MPPKVFCTGTTGYIGGDALYAISNAHPDWEITCLVRNSNKGAKVASQYPRIKLVYGDLDSADLLTDESSKADIVYHVDFANCDHEASAHAIAKGLTSRTKPSFWIHTSGTLILGWETMDKGCFGQSLPKVFDDWDGVKELTSQPDHAAHRVVDKIVLAAASPLVHVAIVCPPTIYGPGRGPDNQRSHQVYEGTRAMLQRGSGFLPDAAENIWHFVHVHDLSDLYLRLGVEASVGGGKATWGKQDGYYLAENGDFVWGDVFKSLAKIAYEKELLPSAETPSISDAELDELTPYGHLVWGTNSRGRAIRGKKLLGWEAKGTLLMDELPVIVESEARALGLIQGHAATVPA